MKAVIHVFLKPGVLDPQGAAVAGALKTMGFGEVAEARQGKFIELELDETDKVRALSRVEEMCQRLLANPVIENYRVEISQG